jgi:hypothetical protein
MKKKMNEMRKFETEKKRKKNIYRKKERKKVLCFEFNNFVLGKWLFGMKLASIVLTLSQHLIVH